MSKTALRSLRFISYMVASELSSVVVLKFRRLYDRPKHQLFILVTRHGFLVLSCAFELCKCIACPCMLAYAGSFEVAVYAPESLTLTSNGFHRGSPAGFQPVGSWKQMALVLRVSRLHDRLVVGNPSRTTQVNKVITTGKDAHHQKGRAVTV